MSPKPRVSVVLPTYNRRDTIQRAITSVRAQAFQDWELVVVDDGSTDGTRDVVEALGEPRIRLIVQENQGVAGARNTALAASRGDLIAFLDSDDAWTPHHLALATAFFDAHPGEHAVTSEFWEDFGDQRYVKHFRVEASIWYPETARRIGSRAFDTPPAHGDPYLWFYETREPIGGWAAAALASSPYQDVYHYRGDVFQGWRWGWLMSLQSTVITRHAMEKVGPNDTSYRIASDFGFLATLCRHFRMSLLSVPGTIKFEHGEHRRALSEDHLVTGRSAIRFHEDVLRFHEELFWRQAPDDPELCALRGFRQSLVAKWALRQGAREVARSRLEQAARTFPGADVSALLWLTRAVPQDDLAALAYRGWLKGAWVVERLRSAVGASRAARPQTTP